MAMRSLAVLVGLTALGALALHAAPNVAKAAAAQQSAAAAQRESFAQASKPRARPQVRVTPRAPYRRYHSAYPVPYKYEYPGPNGVRHCVNSYVTERRPSGAVIVPHMRCWWVVRR